MSKYKSKKFYKVTIKHTKIVHSKLTHKLVEKNRHNFNTRSFLIFQRSKKLIIFIYLSKFAGKDSSTMATKSKQKEKRIPSSSGTI